MGNVSLTALRVYARQRADQEDSAFIDDPELTSYINEGWYQVNDLVIQSYGEMYNVSVTTFTLNAGSDTISLSSTTGGAFYKMQGLDLYRSGTYFTCGRYTWNNRNAYQAQSPLNSYIYGFASDPLTESPYKYSIVGGNINVVPVPVQGDTFRLYYVPAPVTLVNDSDQISLPGPWEYYPAIYAAIKMLNKEESDSSALRYELEAFKKQIQEMTKERDIAGPTTMQMTRRYIYGDYDF